MEQSVSTLLDCSENNYFFKWTQPSNLLLSQGNGKYFARSWQVLRKEMARSRHTQTACLSMLRVCLKCACGIGSWVQKDRKLGPEG